MALTQVDQGLLGTYAQYTGFKNRILNGQMMIDQRNAGASVTPSVDSFTLDRYKYEASQASKFTIQQNAGSVTPPAGFVNYFGLTTASAVSIGASDYFQIVQIIEGLNIGDLAWGTANAKTVTLSFWVRSSLTGTFGGSLRNAAVNRSYPFSYTISSANTWEQKSITIAGDTSGTWLTTNGIGIRLTFGFGNGSTYSGTAGAWSGSNFQNATGATSVVGTNGATFYLTGVQLEVGSTATSFDYRPYGTELQLCQRYCYVIGGNATYEVFCVGQNPNSTLAFCAFTYPVTMRATPTMTAQSAGNYRVYSSSSAPTVTSITTNGSATPNTYDFNIGVASGLTAGNGSVFQANGTTTNKITFNAEL